MRDHLGELGAIALQIEPTTLMSQGIARDDIVDFAIELNDAVVERVQVKGSSLVLNRHSATRQILDELTEITEALPLNQSCGRSSSPPDCGWSRPRRITLRRDGFKTNCSPCGHPLGGHPRRARYGRTFPRVPR